MLNYQILNGLQSEIHSLKKMVSSLSPTGEAHVDAVLRDIYEKLIDLCQKVGPIEDPESRLLYYVPPRPLSRKEALRVVDYLLSDGYNASLEAGEGENAVFRIGWSH